tara:strand:+ start:509 stop:610 length:102 start_codon:yes stop_codon:yes gene_type:complete
MIGYFPLSIEFFGNMKGNFSFFSKKIPTVKNGR